MKPLITPLLICTLLGPSSLLSGNQPAPETPSEKSIKVGTCNVRAEKLWKSIDLISRDTNRDITLLATGAPTPDGKFTIRLPEHLTADWYGLRVNNMADIMMPVYIDTSEFNTFHVILNKQLGKGIVSFNEPPVCDIYDSGTNDWFIESNAGQNTIKKYSDGNTASPESLAFFAFRKSDTTLFIGRMLDFEIIQKLPPPPVQPVISNHKCLSTDRIKWIMNKTTESGHQTAGAKELAACLGCHDGGDRKPRHFPSIGLSNICHRCHAGAAGYASGLYDPEQ